MSMQDLAERIEAALTAEDLDQAASLLADDVRWGDTDEDTEGTCHNRGDVLAWYRRALRSGIHARHIETLVQPHAVVMGWDITWPQGQEERPMVRYQVFTVADDKVVDIRGFPDKEEALAFSARR
jgi:SnoaL-like domain